MKLKLAIALVIATALGSNAYALKLTKARLIEHKLWSTGGAIAKESPGKITYQQALKRLVKQDETYSAAGVSASTQSIKTLVGSEAIVRNDAFTFILNNTNAMHDYYVMTEICVTRQEDMDECVFSLNQYQIEPGGEVFDARAPEFELTMADAGNYPIRALTQVQGEGRAIFSTSLSNATLTVS